MKISISENIKRLRKDRDITQEKLAQALNISVAAVSKWERDETYPDITLLFPLAHYFNVTIDELMGYNKEKIEQDIVDTLKEYTKISKGYSTHYLAKDYITEAYKKYPNDFRIMNAYAWCIAGGAADNDRDTLLKNYDELWEICERTINECNDSSIVLNAKGFQAKLLNAQGKTNEAIEILENNFANSWDNAIHRIEQLFTKDTPEYRYWNKINVYQYARKETNEAYFAIMEYELAGSFNFRLSALRPDMVDDIARLLDKMLSSASVLTELIKSDDSLKKVFSGKINHNPLKYELNVWQTTDHPQISKLRNEPKIIEILNKHSI